MHGNILTLLQEQSPMQLDIATSENMNLNVKYYKTELGIQNI